MRRRTKKMTRMMNRRFARICFGYFGGVQIGFVQGHTPFLLEDKLSTYASSETSAYTWWWWWCVCHKLLPSYDDFARDVRR